MAQAAVGADLIVTAGLGSDAGLAARAAECGGVPAVPIPAALPPGNRERPGVASAQAIAALFTAGALTDLSPFLAAPREAARARGTGGGSPPCTEEVGRRRQGARWRAGRWWAAFRGCGAPRKPPPPPVQSAAAGAGN